MAFVGHVYDIVLDIFEHALYLLRFHGHVLNMFGHLFGIVWICFVHVLDMRLDIVWISFGHDSICSVRVF